MKVIFHGHSCFQITTQQSSIIIDPYLTGNPLTETDAEKVKVEAILLTHGHGDHVGDAVKIAKNNDALVVAPYELAMFMQKQELKVHPMHIGGSREFSFGKVKLTQAIHGSAFLDDDGNITYTGNPCGYLLTIERKTIYHAGDTGLFGDMKKVIGEYHDIALAMLPIGDNFVMGPQDAVIAAKWLGAEKVIPMHYNTFDVIRQDPYEFKKKLEAETDAEAVILKPGEIYEL